MIGLFLACDSSAPVKTEREGAAAWGAGTTAAPRVQGHQLSQPQEQWP